MVQTKVQRSAPRQNYRPLNYVLQLANIARPVIARELLNVLPRQSWADRMHAPRRLFQEARRQYRNVVWTVAQRRHSEWEHAQPKKEILAEAARLHFLLQIPVGRSDHANAHLTSTILANPFKLALLQNAEQFGLQLQRNFGNLIEEQRPPVSDLKPALAVA